MLVPANATRPSEAVCRLSQSSRRVQSPTFPACCAPRRAAWESPRTQMPRLQQARQPGNRKDPFSRHLEIGQRCISALKSGRRWGIVRDDSHDAIADVSARVVTAAGRDTCVSFASRRRQAKRPSRVRVGCTVELGVATLRDGRSR
jgi:hypothetical protein